MAVRRSLHRMVRRWRLLTGDFELLSADDRTFESHFQRPSARNEFVLLAESEAHKRGESVCGFAAFDADGSFAFLAPLHSAIRKMQPWRPRHMGQLDLSRPGRHSDFVENPEPRADLRGDARRGAKEHGILREFARHIIGRRRRPNVFVLGRHAYDAESSYCARDFIFSCCCDARCDQEKEGKEVFAHDGV
jgi:hypothetical protein